MTEYLHEGKNLIGAGCYGEVTEIAADGELHVTVRVYDRTGKLARVLADGCLTRYTYESNGNLLRMENANGTAAAYRYDANGRVTQITEYKNGAEVSACTYTYDAAGNLIVETDGEGNRTEYGYDRSNRLVQVKETGQEPGTRHETAYTYSGANVLEKTETTVGEAPVRTEYQYDGGRLLYAVVSVYTAETGYAKQYKDAYYYDQRGNVTEKRRITGIENCSLGTYLYDGFNQMVLAFMPDGTVRNEYNAFGQRVAKTTAKAGTTRYLLDESRVALEAGESGNTVYFYGNNLISRVSGEDIYHYHYNAHGDVTALTDTSGETAAAFRYDAFGALLAKTGDAESHITYAGYLYDEETGLYYLNARMYDPVSMRFMQYDTYAGRTADALSLNRYAYGQGNPVRYYDPTGHTVEEIWNTVMNVVTRGAWDKIVTSSVNIYNSYKAVGLQKTLEIGLYEAKDRVVTYLTYTSASLLVTAGMAVTVASMGTLSFGGVVLAGLGMGMISAGTSVAMRAYTERQTFNGIKGSLGDYLTTAGLGFATGVVSGVVSSITGGIAGNVAAKAFASKGMSTAAKYAVKYGVLWSSIFVTLMAKKNQFLCLRCSPYLIGGAVSIITVGTDMVIRDISKFFHRMIQRFLCLELVQIDAFIFQCVEIPFHRGVVVWTSCSAHTLAHMDRFTELYEGL